MKQIKEKQCAWCGKMFKPKFYTTQRTCSSTCAFERHKAEGKPKNKTKFIAPVSKKLASRLQVYRIRRDAFMKQNTICQCTGCATPSQDLHHMSGRLGNNLIDESTFMAVCRKCHIWIHENPKQARALKYLK